MWEISFAPKVLALAFLSIAQVVMVHPGFFSSLVCVRVGYVVFDGFVVLSAVSFSAGAGEDVASRAGTVSDKATPAQMVVHDSRNCQKLSQGSSGGYVAATGVLTRTAAKAIPASESRKKVVNGKGCGVCGFVVAVVVFVSSASKDRWNRRRENWTSSSAMTGKG